jgi:hypothetical protein
MKIEKVVFSSFWKNKTAWVYLSGVINIGHTHDIYNHVRMGWKYSPISIIALTFLSFGFEVWSLKWGSRLTEASSFKANFSSLYTNERQVAQGYGSCEVESRFPYINMK